MRQLVLSPRWILWHLLTLGAMATCGFLAAWQWSRAGSAMGSALNVGYGLQWPVFAVFFGVMWWRMLRMEAARLAADAPDGSGAGEAGRAAPSVPAAGAPSSPRSADRSVAAPAGAAPAGSSAPPAEAGAPAPGAGASTAPTADAPSPFGPRPAWARPAPVEEGSGLAAYNRMLAELAARPQD